MSISEVALTQALETQLSNQENSIANLQMQISSGQSLNKPSDNPTAVTQVLALSSQASQMTSWQANAATATSWLDTANSTANSVLDTMQSAQTLLLQAANQGAENPTGYEAIGHQLQGIVSNLLDLANTQYAGRAVFAGTSASPVAYDSTGNYLGNSDTPQVVTGPGTGVGQLTSLSVPGTSMFGTGSSNVFANLTAIANALITGAPTSSEISTALTALSANTAQAQQASVLLGNAAQQASSASASLTTQLSNVQAYSANLEDVNVATATTQLTLETTAYQVALWAASQAVPETLVKFL